MKPLFSSPRRLGKSYLENCLARPSNKLARFSFGQPRSGVRRQAYLKRNETSSVFLKKVFRKLVSPALSAPISCGLERKFIFYSTQSDKLKRVLEVSALGFVELARVFTMGCNVFPMVAGLGTIVPKGTISMLRIGDIQAVA